MAEAGHAAAGVMDPPGLDALVVALQDRGFAVIGPTVRTDAIAYEQIATAAELPVGVGDEQGPARYRLRQRGDEARFGFAAAPSSWKRHLYPPSTVLWRATKDAAGHVEFTEEHAAPGPRAFFGVRACELAAILVQDRVFAAGTDPDPAYAARRADVFIVAVHCGEPAGTCFCASMDTGPRAQEGFDLALTEILDDGGPRYLVEAGTSAGDEVMTSLQLRPAMDADARAAIAVTESAVARMGRHLDTDGIHDLLLRNLDHPRWDDVARRCLSCGNCTLACPTCFCSDEVEAQTVDGGSSERVREWASCFTHDFSYIHGGAVRPTVRARYRQWMTHKLSTWWDQFDSSGCVGCGRCITWCPVGIDITEEAAAIRSADGVRRRARP